MNATILIALIIITLVAGLVFLLKWLTRHGAKKDLQALINAFDALETTHGVMADTREIFKKRIIGIDKSQKCLLFISRSRSKEQAEVLDLQLIKSAVIVRSNNPLSRYTGNITIECLFHDDRKPAVRLNFYDEYYDDVDSLEQMEKKAVCWHQTIMVHKRPAAVNKTLIHI